MPEDDRTVDGSRWRRDPAAGDPCVEQLVGRRAMVPHGDRAHCAKSRRIEDVIALAVMNDDVMREFVLHDDFDDLSAMCEGPRKDVFESAQLHDLARIPALQ